MSREMPRPGHRPLISLAHRANRALQADMVRAFHEGGHPEFKQAYNLVFGSLPPEGARAADMADRAGITRQSMGEIVRELIDLGIVQMQPDPADRRAKTVTYTDRGRDYAAVGLTHIIQLEERFAEELGAREYALVRDALERVLDLLG